MRLYSKASTRWANDCHEMCVEVCMEKGVPIGGLDIEIRPKMISNSCSYRVAGGLG